MRVRSPWVWVAWLAFIAVSFAALEGFALSDPDGLSLSQFYVNVKYAWPAIGVLAGIAIGILICHFNWHWVPKQMRERCETCGRDVLKNPQGG